MYMDEKSGRESALSSSTARPSESRTVVTTFYEYGKNPSPDTVIKKTHSKWPDMATRNAFYAMSQNKYGAGVAEVVDTRLGELHAILAYRMEDSRIETVFKGDPIRPILTTDF